MDRRKPMLAFTGCSTDRVWGVVYRVHKEDKPILDGYDEQQVDVVVESRTSRVWMYVARRKVTDSSLLPYFWYHDFVIHGAQQHRLPQKYIDYLRSCKSVADPDLARYEQNRLLID